MIVIGGGEELSWSGTKSLQSKRYICGYCDNPVSSNIGYEAKCKNHPAAAPYDFGEIYICHHCGKPTFFDRLTRIQQPACPFGINVNFIQSEFVEKLYREARESMKVNAFTAAVMLLQKTVNEHSPQ